MTDKNPFRSLMATQALEEILNDSGQPRQNWVLSYLDVFVLMLMLIVTLLSLSEFTDSAARSQQTQQQPSAPSTPPITAPEPEKPLPIVKLPPVAATPAPKAPPEVRPAPLPQQPPPADSLPPAQPVIEALPLDLTERVRNFLRQLGLDEQITVQMNQDYAQLEIQDHILFASSQSALTESGMALLDNIAPLLQKSSGLILIEGHTDNRPIKTLQFPSNWELGSARATEVLRYLTTQGLSGDRMRAITYGDTQPVASNDTATGRQQNRRVSILVKLAPEAF
ncbi:MAG: OmpA family protein [Methylococcales bacterium]|nr:OmpA family protein [Methylococcales bacterium]